MEGLEKTKIQHVIHGLSSPPNFISHRHRSTAALTIRQMNDNDTPVNRKSDAELNTDIKLKSKIQADPRIKTKPFNIIPQLLEKQT